MTRKTCFLLFFALVAVMVIALPLQAVILGSGSLKLSATGAVSVKAGQTLTLTVTATNNSSVSMYCASLQAVVVDPWTGTRILGPISTPVNQTLEGGYWTYDDSGNPVYYTPGGSTTKTVALAIPRTVPGTYTSTVNKTLAVMIYALDNSSTVDGVTGWAFFATQ